MRLKYEIMRIWYLYLFHKVKYINEKPYNNEKQNNKYKRRHFSKFCVSSSIKSHQSFNSFLVCCSVCAFSASDWIFWLDLLSFSMWHFPQICVIGCCFGGWMSFWVSIVHPHVAGKDSWLCTYKQILTYHSVTKI